MSTEQAKPIRILLYEDKPDYAASFRLLAQKSRVITEQVDNVDDLLERLKTKPSRYQFLVLDARAYNQEGQQEGTEDEVNLFRIFRELQQLEYEQKLHIPHCINTGFADINLRLGGNVVKCPIFEKGDEQSLLKHIWDTYNDSDHAKIRFAHPEIFGFVDAHFAQADLEVVSNLFKNDKYTSFRIEDRIASLSALRRCAEHLADLLYDGYLGSSPGIIKTQASRLGDVVQYLSDQKDIPVHVHSNLTAIRKIASAYGSHTPQAANAIADYPTHNTIIGLALGLADTFAWASTKLTK